MKNEHCCVCCLFLPSGLLCCCATRASSDRCCHWRNVRLRDEFLWRSPSDFWCLKEKTQDWEVRCWVSSIRLVRRTGLLHSSMLGAIFPAIGALLGFWMVGVLWATPLSCHQKLSHELTMRLWFTNTKLVLGPQICVSQTQMTNKCLNIKLILGTLHYSTLLLLC